MDGYASAVVRERDRKKRAASCTVRRASGVSRMNWEVGGASVGE